MQLLEILEKSGLKCILMAYLLPNKTQNASVFLADCWIFFLIVQSVTYVKNICFIFRGLLFFSKVMWSEVAESVTLFCLHISVSQTALFRRACWHPWMMFFMQLLKVTPPQTHCFEIGTSDIPPVILLHNSSTAFSWSPVWKTMAEEFSCSKTANRETKRKEGFLFV